MPFAPSHISLSTPTLFPTLTLSPLTVPTAPPSPSVLLRLGGRKASSVGMALSTLLGQVARLPVPQTKEQEEDDVFSLCRCCSALLVFVRPFVEEAKQSRTPKEDELRTELLKL